MPQLLVAMESSTDFAFAEVGQMHLGSWSHGRIALIGDAAASPSPLTGLSLVHKPAVTDRDVPLDHKKP